MDTTPSHTEIAVFGGGWFWCTEAAFERLKGVISVTPGYAGGHTERPSYEAVSTGETGHAEVVRVVFDPSVIAYKDLLTVFFAIHDPTSLNRQGNDVGTQYRSIVLYVDEAQKREAEAFKETLDAGGGARVVTELQPFESFHEAEAEHHRYFEKHPEAAYCQLVINPKIEKLEHRFKELLDTTRTP